MDSTMTSSFKPGQPTQASASKTKPKRRSTLGALAARVSGLGRGGTFQLLQLLPDGARGMFYAFVHLGNPTNLLFRYQNRVIFESGFGRNAGSGWLALPQGLSNLVEVVLVTRGPCLDSQVDVHSLSTKDTNLTISDGAVLVAAGRQQRALLRIPVRLGAPAVETVSVRWRTLAGTASDGRGGGDQADFQASGGLLIFRPGQQEQTIEIPVFGDTPINSGSDKTFEILARDSAYNNQIQKQGLDVDKINGHSYYGDLGYRVDRSFHGPEGFQALGLTASESFYVLISDPVHGLLTGDSAESERLLADLKETFGGNNDSPEYQRALALVQELKTARTPWRFAKATIHDAGRAPVLAIRGTEPTRELADVWTDLHPGGIGATQYQLNRDQLLTWLQQVSQPKGVNATLAPHITGHSLGGALAQWLAADYAGTGSLGDVVTFNAPGISRDAAAADLSTVASVRHYVTSTDIVSLAGEAFLPGHTVISDAPGSFQSQMPIAGPHLHPVLVPSLSSGSLRPAGLMQRVTGAINNPLFTYLPDPDYLLFLLAVARIPVVGPPLAAALTTRSGVEQARARIGAELISKAGQARLSIATAEAVSRAASSWSPLAWETISHWSAEAWKAAGQWESKAWDSTRLWSQDAWTAMRHWNDQAWAATNRWSSTAWEATTHWVGVIWDAMESLQPKHGDHLLFGSVAAEQLRGDDGADILDGLGGDDQLVGGRGDDLLIAGRGTTRLEGGAGSDRFLINAPGEGIAWIEDFNSSQGDQIALNISALGLATSGLTLAPTDGSKAAGPAPTLRLGSVAALAEDRLLYDRQSGQLLLDADGTGPDAARSVALLLNRPELRAEEIMIWQQEPIAPDPALKPPPTQAGTRLRLSQSVGSEAIVPGGWVTITTIVENPGPERCENADLLLELPDGVALTNTKATVVSAIDPRLAIGLGPLGAGERRTLTLTLQVPEGRTAASYRLRTWAAGPRGGLASSSPAAELTLEVQPPRQADLLVWTSPHADEHALHGPFDSFSTVHNQGSVAATNVVLTEVVPSGVTVESITGAQANEIADGVMRFQLGTLQPGEHRTVKLSMRSKVAGLLTALSEVSSESDSDPTNNVATTTYVISSGPLSRCDLQLNLSANRRNPRVGDLLELSASLSNQGPGDAAGPVVAVPCPAGLVIESVEADQGSYDPATGLWDVGSLGLGVSTTLRLRARVRQEGLWLAQAEVVDQADLDVDSIAGNERPGEDDLAIIAIRASNQPQTGVLTVSGPRTVVAGERDPIAIPLTFSDTTGNNQLDSFELALHFDSRVLQFNDISKPIRPLVRTPQIENDSDDRDGNAATDKRVLLRWQDSNRNVAGDRLPPPLVTASFRPTAAFTDTLIGLSAGTTVAGRGFAGDPIAVQRRPWTLDIDGDGRFDNVTDGALLLRYAFGYEIGPELIRSLIGSAARRRSPEAISTYIQEGLRSGELDLDGNGRFDALTDGLMLIRYNADMAQGDQLTNGALAVDATITSSSEITAHLQRLTTLL